MLNQNEIRKEQEQIIGIIPVMDMRNFVKLLLADLASKSKIYKTNGNKYAHLSTDYKKIIEDIMYEENGWGIRFATLINIHTYYEFQSEWEQKLGRTLKKVLTELNKKMEFDYENDKIIIEFTKEEIDIIKSQYDVETLEVMDHFSNLMDNIIFKRNYGLTRREMDRSVARYQNHLEDLKLRTKYSQKVGIPIAKKIIK